MKLLFAIKSLDSTRGGAEKVLANVTAMFAEREYEVQILSFDKQGGQSVYPLNNKVSRLSLEIGHPEQNTTFWEALKRMVALRKEVKKQKPDVVIAFMHSMFVPMAFALIGTGVPVIASEHIVPQYYQSRKIEFVLLAASSFLVKGMTVLSNAVRALYPSYIQRRMSVIPNPVFIGNTRGEKSSKPARKRILNIGRLDPQKDQKTLIAAFARLANDFPDWDLRIIGEGPLRPDLESQTHALNLSERISLPGTTDKIALEYEAASLFAMPSRFESFGLVTAEAMSYSVPAVGFADCPGTNEIIVNQENGLLVAGENRVQAFADGLECLMKDESLRHKMGATARQSVERYSDEHVFEAWEALIKKAI
jgi:glycosyltransferase involved in cell wall biosynthesis